MNLNNFIVSGDQYQHSIIINDLPVYIIQSATSVNRTLSQTAENIHAIGTKEAVGSQSNGKTNSFKVDIQSGEAVLLVRAARAAGYDIQDFRDIEHFDIVSVDLHTGAIERYIDCVFSDDSQNKERKSVETLRELSGVFTTFKSI